MSGLLGDVNVKNTAQWTGVAAAVPATVTGLAAGSAFLYKKSHPDAMTPAARDLISAAPRVAGAAALITSEAMIIGQINWPGGEKGYYSGLAGGAFFGATTAAGITALAKPGMVIHNPREFAMYTMGAAAAGAALGGIIGAFHALKGGN
jgi:hypothetical protein